MGSVPGTWDKDQIHIFIHTYLYFHTELLPRPFGPKDRWGSESLLFLGSPFFLPIPLDFPALIFPKSPSASLAPSLPPPSVRVY